jgi:hypothetical protein
MFKSHYDGWRESRMNGIKKYVRDDIIRGKCLFEVGAGHADLGNMFHQLGAIVHSSDARSEYINIINQRYPYIQTSIFDCDNDILNDKYDIILHWGVLYHIKHIKSHLANICSKCDYLFLETEVIDSSENNTIHVNENGYDQAFNSVGSRPSQHYVEQTLAENDFEFVLINDPILNSSFHIYDWNISNDGSWRHGLRRYWICWKRGVPSPMK